MKFQVTYFHILPKTYGKIFVTPFNVSENFYTPPPLKPLTGSNGVSLLALSLTIQMYQICTPKFHGYDTEYYLSSDIESD
jgi:hypothetical protein